MTTEQDDIEAVESAILRAMAQGGDSEAMAKATIEALKKAGWVKVSDWEQKLLERDVTS